MDIANMNATDNTGMIIEDENDVLNLLNNAPHIQWDEVLIILVRNPGLILSDQVLKQLRESLECNGASQEVLDQLIEMFPKELAFSLFLSVMKCPDCTSELFQNIVNAIQEDPHYHMEYCIQRFKFPIMKDEAEFNLEDVIGAALTIAVSPSQRFNPTIIHGKMHALKHVKRWFPKSILFGKDTHFTPIHGVAAVAASNIEAFKFFINWYRDKDTSSYGGLYVLNDAGLTPVHILIETKADITTLLDWLKGRGWISSTKVENGNNASENQKKLIHFAAQYSSLRTLDFLIQLYPSGVFEQDIEGNLPIQLHLGLRDRENGTFSDQDFEITKLLTSKGIMNGGVDTIGGLFHKDPYSDEDEKCCTLTMLLDEVGDANTDRVWEMIDTCLNKVGDYADAPIVHAAIKHKHNIPDEVFQQILDHFGAFNRDDEGRLPLTYAMMQGFEWEEIAQPLISNGIMNMCLDTIGGLFHKDPYSDEDEKCCTLTMLLDEVGDANTDRVWEMIDTCLNEVGDYADAPIVHAAIKHKHNIPDEVFQIILNRYDVLNCNDRERSPLMHAVSLGLRWDDGLSAILERNHEALDETDGETGLLLLGLAALKYGEDLSTLFKLMMESSNVLRTVAEG